MKNEEVKEKKTTTKKTTTGNKKEGVKTASKKQQSKQNASKKEKVVPKEEVIEDVEIIEVKKEKTTATTKKIKTSDIVLILGLVLVVILGCFLMKGEKVEPSYELPLTLSGEVGLQQLTYQEYQEKVDNDESFVLVIERATCSHCVTYMPIAEEFASNYGVPMYYVDTDTFSEEDWEGFEKSNTFLKKNNGSWGTPTTIVLAGNEAVDYIEGTTTAETLEQLYNEYFDMSEE